jgi:hypothetical protein
MPKAQGSREVASQSSFFFLDIPWLTKDEIIKGAL